MFSSLCYRFSLFVKSLTKTDHDNTGIYIHLLKRRKLCVFVLHWYHINYFLYFVTRRNNFYFTLISLIDPLIFLKCKEGIIWETTKQFFYKCSCYNDSNKFNFYPFFILFLLIGDVEDPHLILKKPISVSLEL